MLIWLMRAVLGLVVAFSALMLWGLFRKPESALDRGLVAALVLVGTLAIWSSFSANPSVRMYGGGIGAVLTLALFGWLLTDGFLVAVMGGV